MEKQDAKSETVASELSIKEDEKHQVHGGGDTALANAPWKFKIIALVTALLFPCKKTTAHFTHKLTWIHSGFPLFC